MKLDADEKELLESVERGEWKSACASCGSSTSSLESAVVAPEPARRQSAQSTR
jgi:hypothetical protein